MWRPRGEARQDFKVCALCKLAKDDATYNPLYPNSDGWNYIPQGFTALQENQRDVGWMQEDPKKSMQNLFNLVANGYFLKDDKATLKNWGFLMLEPGDADMVTAAPSFYSFVEHQVDVQGRITSYYAVQHDPGNVAYAKAANTMQINMSTFKS